MSFLLWLHSLMLCLLYFVAKYFTCTRMQWRHSKGRGHIPLSCKSKLATQNDEFLYNVFVYKSLVVHSGVVQGVKKVGEQNVAIFRQDSDKQLQTSANEIMSAQNFNLAHKFPTNWALSPNFGTVQISAFLDENFPTRKFSNDFPTANQKLPPP